MFGVECSMFAFFLVGSDGLGRPTDPPGWAAAKALQMTQQPHLALAGNQGAARPPRPTRQLGPALPKDSPLVFQRSGILSS